MTAPTVNPRSLGIEAEFITTDVHELAELKDRLVAAGISSGKANGIVGWLVDKATGRPDATASNLRADYRKILAELPPAGPPAKGRNGKAPIILVASSGRVMSGLDELRRRRHARHAAANVLTELEAA